MLLEKLRGEVVKAAKEAEYLGLCLNLSGNFSARDEASGLVCMTPSGADRNTLTAEDIVVMNMSGEVVWSKAMCRPSSEAMMHIAAYETRQDIFAVAHTHSKFALTFAALGRPIPPVVLESAHLKCADGIIPIAPFARQGTRALADSVRAPLTTGDALLLASHGVVAVGKNSDDALLKAAYVEEISEIYYRMLMVSGGREPQALAPEDLVLSGEKNRNIMPMLGGN